MNAPAVFSFESHEVRTVEKDGEAWFIARDVFDALDLSWNGARTLETIPADWQGVVQFTTPSGIQPLMTINEHAIYKIAFRSRKESADRFTNEIAKIVTTIRKTGKYEVVPQHALPTYSEALRQLADKVDQLEQQKPLVAFAQAVADSSNSMDLGKFAGMIGTGKLRLFRWLKDHKYLMDSNKPFQKYLENGYFELIETTYPHGEQTRAYAKPQITGKGQIAIEKIFREEL